MLTEKGSLPAAFFLKLPLSPPQPALKGTAIGFGYAVISIGKRILKENPVSANPLRMRTQNR